MLDAGTVITLTRRAMKEVLSPIYERLHDEQSLLRQSGDPSMLVQALLDVCEYLTEGQRVAECRQLLISPSRYSTAIYSFAASTDRTLSLDLTDFRSRDPQPRSLRPR